MQFFSTRDQNRKVTSSEAIAQGLSNEGGLFVPESFPQVDVQALCALDYPEMAAVIVGEYLTDYSKEFLAQATKTTYGAAFGGKAGDVVVGGGRRQNAAVNAPALRGVVVRENEENIGMLLWRLVRASCGHGENSDGGRAYFESACIHTANIRKFRR